MSMFRDIRRISFLLLRCLVSVVFSWLLVACGSEDVVTVEPNHSNIVSGAPRPNILLIMVDDLGFNDLAANNGNQSIQTPNMDALAQQGVRFTRHYAASVCSPARAALLSGQYPERNGYLPAGRGISPEVVTMPESLREAGYTTWHIGKWHLGDLDRDAWPDRQGFDHWFGFLNQWRLAGKHKDGQLQLVRPRYKNPWLQGDSDTGRHYQGHLEDILTDRAIDVLSDLEESQAPWFLNLWFYAPHTPIKPSKTFARQFPDSDQGRYRALVKQLDHNIGRVLAHLDDVGASKNTMVVLMSDNGGTNRQVDNNAPFMGKKGTVFEGGLRTPLIIRWPEVLGSPKVFTDSISIMDIFPTVLAALDISPPENLDGLSFYDAILGNGPAPARPRFWQHGPSYSDLSSEGRWRFYSPPTFPSARSTPRLFDLEADFTGEQNVIPLPAAPVSALYDDYLRWGEDVHRVKLKYAHDEQGDGALTGMSFQRTPGYGGYTFTIGVAPEREGMLAQQRDIWQLRRTGNTISAQFGDQTLSGQVKSANVCHSVVISGVFYRHTSSFSGPDRTSLTLYVDGKETDSFDSPTALVIDDTTVETIIGNPGSVNSGLLSTPVILNAEVGTFPGWTLDSLDRAVCKRT